MVACNIHIEFHTGVGTTFQFPPAHGTGNTSHDEDESVVKTIP